MSASERRLTQFPGSSSSGLGKRHAEVEPDGSSRQPSSKVLKVPEFLHSQLRPHPPAIPLKANPTSQQFVPTSRFPKICRKGNPWQEYYGILKEDQAGQVTVAYKNEIEHPIFAIKEHTCINNTSVNRLVGCSHKNIVSFYQAYLEKDTLHLVYEWMDISLAEIQSTHHGNLASFQIAAVCREVIHGVQYIHKELGIVYGSINSENIMVSKSGSVKLANIGQSMLKHLVCTQNEQQDFQALGPLMVRLMELGTSLQSPGSVILQDPDRWEDPIKSFLQKTQRATGEELEKDEFLELSPSSCCLKPLVFITEKSIHRPYDICMN